MTASQLFLRPLTEDDIPTIFSLTSDPEVARFMRFSTQCRILPCGQMWRTLFLSGYTEMWIGMTPYRGRWSLQQRDCSGLAPDSLFIRFLASVGRPSLPVSSSSIRDTALSITAGRTAVRQCSIYIFICWVGVP